MSIRAQLLLLILIATLIPAIVVGVNFLQYRETEIADARRRLSAMAQYIAKDLSDTVRATAQLHYGLSRARDLDTQNRAACSGFLANVLKEYPQYTGILTITPKGDLFCDSLRTGRELLLTDRRYFQQARTSGNPLAVEPAFGRLTGIAVLQIAYAARNDAGELRFVQLASLNLEKYAQSRSTNLPFESVVLALMDGKGTMLAWHPGGEKLRGTSFADSPLHRLARGREGRDVSEDIDVGGKSRVWATAALSEFPDAELYILVGVSKADLVAAANRRLNHALGILAIFLLLALGGAWALAELGIRRQAARLIAAVARFSGGDYGARVGRPYPRGEIGGLMAALDRAFELMQAQRDAIQKLNADLEDRVQQRTAALEMANRELGAFSYSVSHDLRAPLRAIDGFGLRLAEASRDKLDATALHYLDRIRAGTQVMAQLIEDLLSLSHVSRTELTVHPVSLSALAQRIADELRQRDPGRTVAWSIAGDATAAGDERLLEIALENLLGNAWKFTSKCAEASVEFGVTQQDGETAYFVRDNGAGFDMAYAEKLFAPFQRLHGAAEFPGTGIGLATVRRIIQRHGGRVWAQAAVDQGATFYFTLGKGAEHDIETDTAG